MDEEVRRFLTTTRISLQRVDRELGNQNFGHVRDKLNTIKGCIDRAELGYDSIDSLTEYLKKHIINN